MSCCRPKGTSFNTQPPEGGWMWTVWHETRSRLFQHTAARRRLGPKAGASVIENLCFNTQPPEGGWGPFPAQRFDAWRSFNTQPPEGGWWGHICCRIVRRVSTHSRPKAAGLILTKSTRICQGFNTQPPEGGWETLSIRSAHH